MSATISRSQDNGAIVPVKAIGGLESPIFDFGSVACDNSYPSGGYAMAGISDVFRRCDNILYGMKNGYLFEYDSVNDKMIVKTPVAALAAHTHTTPGGGNVEVEEEAIAAPAHQRIYHGAVTGTFSNEIVRGGTSLATARVTAHPSGYLDITHIGIDACNILLGELITDYNLHCANVTAHIAADTANDGVALQLGDSLAEMYVAANALKAAYNAHDAETGAYHGAAGSAHQTAANDATTHATLVTLLNELKSDYEAHRAEGDTLFTLVTEIRADLVTHMANAAVHIAADTTNNDFIALAGNNLAAIMACLNSMKAKYNSHDTEATLFHCHAGTGTQVASADATTYASAVALANELKADLNTHCGLTSLAYLELVELRTDYLLHCAMGAGTHSTVDIANNTIVALTQTIASMYAVANDLKVKFNAHDAETGVYHLAAGTAHQITAANATTYATLKALLIELKSDYNAHCADDNCHDTVDTTNTIAAADATDECHLAVDATAVAAADAAASLHLFPDATNTIATANAGLTLQTAEVLTGLSSAAFATSSSIAIDVWDLAFPPADVQTVINQANARLAIASPSMALVTTECRVDLANAEIETLLSDAYTALKVTYLKDAEAAGTSGSGGAVVADLAEEVTTGTNLSTLTGIPYIAWGI